MSTAQIAFIVPFVPSSMTEYLTRRFALKGIVAGAALGVSALLLKRAGWLPSSFNNKIEPAERAAMADVAERFMRRFDAPGLSVAFARDGQPLYQEAFGLIGHNAIEAMTTSNLFRIASISKTITSAAIFSLIEKGQLRGDNTVFGERGILGTMYGRQPYGSGIEQITIDHLLTHTSGGWSNQTNDAMFSHPTMSQADILAWALDNQPLSSPPGQTWAYSNVGYFILGRVIEKVSGQRYSEFVQDTILNPCGITGMLIGGNTLEDRAPGEVSYYGQGQAAHDDPYSLNVARMDANGGWIATPADLVRFASHVDGFDPSRNILKPETIRAMTTPCNIHPSYARGWGVNARGNWWHEGDLAGTTSILVRTASRFCWAAIINTRRDGADGTRDAIDGMTWEMASKVSAWQSALA